jgi:hypothetical protein
MDTLPACTEQLWGMPAIGAAWTESMQLGAALEGKAREELRKEVECKNIELGKELAVTALQLHIARQDLDKARERKKRLRSNLSAVRAEREQLTSERDRLTSELDRMRGLEQLYREAQVELALLKREREEWREQDRLAVDIWGPRVRSEPDGSWDPQPVLLFSVPPATGASPVTVGRIAAELGYKCTAQHIHQLGSHVRDAFMRAHGRCPEPRVFYSKDGSAERVGCFTERDRDLIASVIRLHGEPV